MLDINLFRIKSGHNPERIRESQRYRYEDDGIVDEIIQLDDQRRKLQYDIDGLNHKLRAFSKQCRDGEISESERGTLHCELKTSIFNKKSEVAAVELELRTKLESVGNLVHDSVPIDNDEKHNLVVGTWGEVRVQAEAKNHVQLMQLLGMSDTERGSQVAGGRGYYLDGYGVRLNHALIEFGLDFLEDRKFKSKQTPFFMRKEIMSKCAQLAQFDEELYKVTGDGEDKYLIATAEQPLCAFHMDEWIHPSKLPIRYAGYSSCFRKEAGSHGRDTLGLFRVHQFEKIEQFCITSPDDSESWDMHEEMIKNSEEFYQLLGIPYRVVSVVSGKLNAAAAKKYDLEGWFPASKSYKELVSCSNCTDYQSRRLEIRCGYKEMNTKEKKYVHMLNSTLTATERTLCCILENYQTERGVEIPEVLRPYLRGKSFIEFETVTATTDPR